MQIFVNDPSKIIYYYHLFINYNYYLPTKVLSIQKSTKFYFTLKKYFKSQLDPLWRKDCDLFHINVDITWTRNKFISYEIWTIFTTEVIEFKISDLLTIIFTISNGPLLSSVG